jgi:hypothetical protein
MKKQKLVPVKSVGKFENLKLDRLEFECTETAIKRIRIFTEGGSYIEVYVNSYSVEVYEPETVTMYRATIVDSKGILPDHSKDFDSENERDRFVQSVDDNDGSYSRFTVALSQFDKVSL